MDTVDIQRLLMGNGDESEGVRQDRWGMVSPWAGGSPCDVTQAPDRRLLDPPTTGGCLTEIKLLRTNLV